MKTPLLLSGMVIIIFLSGCKKDLKEMNESQDTVSTSRPGVSLQEGNAHVPNEILVKFKNNISQTSRSQALSRIGGQVSERILTKAMQHNGENDGVYLIHTPLDVFEAISKMKSDAEIVYAEQNFIYQHDLFSNDTYYTNGTLWGMYGDGTSPANQYGSQAGEAWAAGHTGAYAVYAGIIDEGIQFTHPELDAQIWTNPFDPADGIDNDGNGYVDDIHGWDFAGNDNTIYDGGSRGSLDDHGTHVSGTIGAESNGTGVAGVNWKVTLISGKFLGRRGGTTANAIKAVDYFTDLKNRHGLNIPATNNSWGGGGFSQGLKDAIGRANTANILFVAAAGNDGNNTETSISYPSGYDNANIIAVAAIDKTGALASFSNYALTKVDLGAPGVGVMSTTAFNTYSSYSGTSMATPHVTGGAALYASTHPGSSAATIKAAILNSAVPTASLSGKCVTGGRLNVSGF
ncbi:MAG: S8 family peptidase [Ginsengibacter sp.]